jgi:chitosanase
MRRISDGYTGLRYASAAACAALVLVAGAATAAGAAPLTDEQRARADRLIAVFENGVPELQYGYAEVLGDGRGITAGRAGFTSGTGDLLEVVERYTAAVPDNPLAGYLPRLGQLAKRESGATSGLRGFVKAWRVLVDDPALRQAQDSVIDEYYYDPAMRYADDLGVELALSRAVLYDTAVQHGDGDDPDGVSALIERAGPSPADGVDERTWLRFFLRERRRTLAHATDPETRDVWAESVGRVDVLRSLLRTGQVDLDAPLHLKAGGHDETVP